MNHEDEHMHLRCIMDDGAYRWTDLRGRTFLRLHLDDGQALDILLTNATYTAGRDMLLAAIAGGSN